MDVRDLVSSVRRLDWDGVLNTFLALPARQQTIALAVAIGTAAMIIVMPMGIVVGSLQALDSEITDANDKLSNLMTDVQKYREASAQVDELQKVFAGQSRDSLRTAVSQVATETNVKVDDMAERGSKESFEFHEEEKGSFRLKNIALKDLVAFLHNLETSTQRIIRVKKMTIRPDQRQRDQLNAEFSEIGAYRLLEGGAK